MLTNYQAVEINKCIEDALTFFNELTRHAPQLDIRLLDDSKTLPAISLSNFQIDKPNIERLIQHNNKGYGIFATVNCSNGDGVSNSNIINVRALFADFDDTKLDNLSVINALPLKPNIVIETSPKKYHVYWFLDDCKPEDFKKTQLAISKKLGSDPSIVDLARIMRVPGFLHQKGDPFLSRVLATNANEYKYQDIVDSLDIQISDDSPHKAANTAGKDLERELALLDISGEIGKLWLDDLYAPNGAMPFLQSIDYGSSNDEFVKLAANHQPFLGTCHAARAKQLFDDYLIAVGGNYDREENERRMRTFNKGHPAALINIAEANGWINPKKIYASGFKIKNDGIYKLGNPDRNGEIRETKVCSWLIVKAQTYGVGGFNRGFLLQWRDSKNLYKEKAIKASDLHNPASLVEYLTDAGLSIVPTKIKEVLTYINAFDTPNMVDCAVKSGWYVDGSFVTPSHSHRPSNNQNQLLFQGSTASKELTVIHGSLKDWQESVSKLCIGNSRLVLSVCAAFTAPVLNIVQSENFGMHKNGDSSLGKTTVLRVASSVYGSPEYLKSWKATDTALEHVAADYNDLLLPLDELKQATPETISSAIYMLANGRGKERGRKDGGLREVQSFRTVLLSTGERTPAELLDEKGGIHGGQEVRLINIPADTGKFGIFEELHHCKSGGELADLLTKNAKNIYGTAGREWLKYLVENSKEEIAQQIQTLKCEFLVATDNGTYDGQLTRVLEKFALLAAVGEVATEAGITDWPKNEAFDAAVKSFHAYLAYRGGTGRNEDQDIIEKVRSSLMAHGDARFDNVSNLSDARNKVHNRLGYKVRTDKGIEVDSLLEDNQSQTSAGTGYYYLVQQHGLEKLAEGYSAIKIAKVLDKNGYLLTSTGRKTYKWNNCNQRRDMEGTWFYTITPQIFHSDDI